MGLLAPWLLLLGVAAAVPILLHLMHRRPGPRLEFPALRYLRRAQKESGRRVRLRQLLLLALRIAAVLLLAFAAARPFFSIGSSAHPPSDVVLVLDNSMSTGAVVDDARVFDALRAAARATLDAAGPEDRFWLVRAAEPWQPALFGERARIAEALERVEPVDARADLRAAVRRARALLASAGGERPAGVHVLTDLQATAFDAADRAGAGAADHDDASGSDEAGASAVDVDDGAPVLIYGPAGDAPPNRGVSDVLVAGGLAPRAGVAATLSAAVVGAGDAAGAEADDAPGADSVTLRLWLGEQPVAAALAASGAAAVFALPARPTGFVLGRVESEPDALSADDRAWFAYAVAPPVPVAAAVGTPFVAEALAALASAQRIRLGGADGAAVLVADAATLPAAIGIDALVLLPPDSAVLLPAANATLARLGTGLRLEPDPARGSATVIAGNAGAAPELRDTRVARAYRIRVAAGALADTLLRLSDGRPWLVRADATSGARVLLLASPLVPDASTVPASAAMIPLLDRLTGEWSGAAGAPGALEAGTTVQLPARAAVVVTPADSLHAVEGGAPWQLPARAGVYRALASGQPGAEVLAAWTVAAPAAESRLERIEPDAARDALGGDVDVIAGDDARWRDAIFAQRTGGEWWRWLLVAAIIALLVESFTAATRRDESNA